MQPVFQVLDLTNKIVWHFTCRTLKIWFISMARFWNLRITYTLTRGEYFLQLIQLWYTWCFFVPGVGGLQVTVSEHLTSILVCTLPRGWIDDNISASDRYFLGLVQPSGRPAELVSKHFVCFGFALGIFLYSKRIFHYA